MTFISSRGTEPGAANVCTTYSCKGHSFRNVMQHKAIFIFRIMKFIKKEKEMSWMSNRTSFIFLYRYNDRFAGAVFLSILNSPGCTWKLLFLSDFFNHLQRPYSNNGDSRR